MKDEKLSQIEMLLMKIVHLEIENTQLKEKIEYLESENGYENENISTYILEDDDHDYDFSELLAT